MVPEPEWVTVPPAIEMVRPPAVTAIFPEPLALTVPVPVIASPPVVTVRFPSTTLRKPVPATVRPVPAVTAPVRDAITEPPIPTVIAPEVEKIPPVPTVTGRVTVAVAAWKLYMPTSRLPPVKVSEFTSAAGPFAAIVTAAPTSRLLRLIVPSVRFPAPVILIIEVPAVVPPPDEVKVTLPLVVMSEEPKSVIPAPEAENAETPVTAFDPRFSVPPVWVKVPASVKLPAAHTRLPLVTCMELTVAVLLPVWVRLPAALFIVRSPPVVIVPVPRVEAALDV